MTDPASSPQSSPTVHRGRLLAVLLAPLFMALVSISVLNVGLTAIGESLHASSTGLQWAISGYTLAFGVLLVPAGRLGDATGRRRIFVLGIAAFTVGSLISGLALNIETLNLARVLQGLGSGLLNPQTIGLIQQHFRGQRRAHAFASLGTTVAVATAIGPVIGGFLIQTLGPDVGWRWMFLMNIPIGVFSIVFALRWIPDDRLRSDRRADLDPIGTGLLTLAILAIMFPFLERSAGPLVWLGVPAGFGILLVWWVWEDSVKRRGRQPMVDPAIFSNAGFRNGIIIVATYFLGATSIWIIVPLYLQMHLEYTAFQAALIGIPSSIAAAISSQLGGRFVLRLGRRLVTAGFATSFVGIGVVAILAGFVEREQIPFWVLAIPLTLVGTSQGMTISPNQTLTLNSVDPRFGGVAGGILSLGQRMGAAVGTALIPGIVFSLTENGGSWLEAFTIALAVIMALTLAAMAVSIRDRQREKAGVEM